jgi:hypothetical protein
MTYHRPGDPRGDGPWDLAVLCFLVLVLGVIGLWACFGVEGQRGAVLTDGHAVASPRALPPPTGFPPPGTAILLR